ncbi:hypothetical protein BX600DRAFT_321509 [Xylariales sp. PMI_506]|nr:hypothetical protein BX600DRAFT_321509 [Xylariales sp. PMI_506]
MCQCFRILLIIRSSPRCSSAFAFHSNAISPQLPEIELRRRQLWRATGCRTPGRISPELDLSFLGPQANAANV